MHKLCIQIYAPFYRKLNIYGEREMGEFQTSISFMGTVWDGIVLLAEILKINTYQIPLVAPSKGERATENLLYYTTSIKVLRPPFPWFPMSTSSLWHHIAFFFPPRLLQLLAVVSLVSKQCTNILLPSPIPSHPTPPHPTNLLYLYACIVIIIILSRVLAA